MADVQTTDEDQIDRTPVAYTVKVAKAVTMHCNQASSDVLNTSAAQTPYI